MTGGHQRMALAFAIAASALARPVCRDEHEECANWARLGECDANPNYMHESCAPACGTCGSRVDALGFTVDLWAEEMNGHDRDTFANNARINRDQPPTVPAFTDVGFAVRPIPRDVHAALLAARDDKVARGDLRREGCVRGYINNCGAHPTYSLPVPPRVRTQVNDACRAILEAWIGPKWGGLVPTSVYGIRRYTNGSTLQAHVGVVATHAVSAILNVDQDVDEDWPLQIRDHGGDVHAVVMKPGEMVLYESSKSIHGRLVPLNGASYDNIFVHFRPRLGWDRFTGVPNGAVLSDHIEL